MQAVIVVTLIYGGGPEGLDKFAAPFRALKPAAEQQLIRAAYPDVFDFLRNNESSVAICAKGWNRHLWPNYLKSHNPTALRRVHTIFNSVTTKYPAMANMSVFALEGYSLQAVTRVPADSTATPFREYPILACVSLGFCLVGCDMTNRGVTDLLCGHTWTHHTLTTSLPPAGRSAEL